MDKIISSSDFKKHLYSLINEVEMGNSFIITRREKEVARVVPIGNNSPKEGSSLGKMRAVTKINGDIVTSSYESEWKIIDEQ